MVEATFSILVEQTDDILEMIDRSLLRLGFSTALRLHVAAATEEFWAAFLTVAGPESTCRLQVSANGVALQPAGLRQAPDLTDLQALWQRGHTGGLRFLKGKDDAYLIAVP